MPLDKFGAYAKAAGRKERTTRLMTIADLNAVVAAAFGGSKLKDYIDELKAVYDGDS